MTEAIARHGGTAMEMTGEKNARDASQKLLHQGYVGVRGTLIAFAKAEPSAIRAALDEAKQSAEYSGPLKPSVPSRKSRQSRMGSCKNPYK